MQEFPLFRFGSCTSGARLARDLKPDHLVGSAPFGSPGRRELVDYQQTASFGFDHSSGSTAQTSSSFGPASRTRSVMGNLIGPSQ